MTYTDNEGTERVIMVCLDHPCYGIDVIRDATPDVVDDLRGQGYCPLSEIRQLLGIHL